MIGASVGLVTYSIFDKASVLAVFVAFFAGLISHYLFDAVPHGHYEGVSFDDGISDREIDSFICLRQKVIVEKDKARCDKYKATPSRIAKPLRLINDEKRNKENGRFADFAQPNKNIFLVSTLR